MHISNYIITVHVWLDCHIEHGGSKLVQNDMVSQFIGLHSELSVVSHKQERWS
jgi:hypothetical protein